MKLKRREPLVEYDESDLIDEKVLKIRGISDDEKYDFLLPKKKHLNSPFLMGNMRKSVDAIISGIEKGLKFGVYGDVDVDGVTSLQIILGYLSLFTENIQHILHQREQGHGVIPSNVPNDIDILIIVDSSTNSVVQCKELKDRGVEIITFDHHIKTVDNPYALIVNPQICDYPNKHLSGAGICWQFCRAFDEMNGIEFAYDFVDLACVGMVADMMNMRNLENRYIVFEGLSAISRRVGNLGLRALFKELGKDYRPTSLDISFYVAPCLNAIIRLDDINILMELFNCDDMEVAKLMAKEIKSKNEERKELTDAISKSVASLITNDKITILDMSEFDYPRGLFGLIANKVARDTQKPCLCGKVEDGIFSGSGRGFGDEVDLRSVLKSSKLLIMAEGHENSFGIKFNIENKDRLVEHCNKKFKKFYNEQYLLYDLQIDFEEMTEDNLKLVDELNFICGEGFPQATFLLKGITFDDANKIGKKQNHTKLTKNDEMKLDIMKFNTEEQIEKYQCDYVDVVGSIGLNSFYNFGLKKTIVSKQILADEIFCMNFDI